MIAVDSSSLIDYLSGLDGADLEAVDDALHHGTLHLPPVVVAEVLSNPLRRVDARLLIASLPVLEVTDGYWERAGQLRATMRSRGVRAALADTLIAQSCLDHEVPLITRDADFRQFARFGLKLI